MKTTTAILLSLLLLFNLGKPVIAFFQVGNRDSEEQSLVYKPDFAVCYKVEEFPKIQAAGYQYVESNVSRFLVPDKSEFEFKENLDLKNRLGARIISCTSLFPGTLKITGPETLHPEALAWADTAFRRAEEAQIPFIIFGSGTARKVPDGFSKKKATEQFISFCKQLAPIAAKYHVTVLVEPLNTQETNLINSLAEGAAVVKVVNHPNIKLLCDIYHMLKENEPASEIIKYSSYIRHCHIAEKEVRSSPGTQGDDFTSYFQALKTIHYKGCLSIECNWTDADQELVPALEYMKKQFEALSAGAPYGLTTDLLEHTDKVFINGTLSTLALKDLNTTVENNQVAAIYKAKPFFGWIVNDRKPDVLQTAYRIMIATNAKDLMQDKGDMWDSGRIDSDNSTAVQYAGKPLQPSTVYYWKVQTWNNYGEVSPFSGIKAFITGEVLDGRTARYSLQKTDDCPVNKVLMPQQSAVLYEFGPCQDVGKKGRAAFGQLRFTVHSQQDWDTVIVHLAEKGKGNDIDSVPGGTIRYARYVVPLMKGTHTYYLKINPDKRNTGPQAVLMPGYIGEVLPFRYCKIQGNPETIASLVPVRETVHYPFDDTASFFHSSDSILNQVWDLCKYSIKATSFAGVYVDGDRERIPYEADALINQLCHYSVDREFSMARYSYEYLIRHATWPTEWIMQSVIMAWNDYLYTGNPASLHLYYNDIKAKTLTALSDSAGLISTLTGKQTPEFLQSVYFNGKALKDIVDWPHSGILGLDEKSRGEDDYYVYTNYNTVVNAYHYEALRLMDSVAGVLGEPADKKFYSRKAGEVKQQINKLLFDKKNNRYRDGIGTDHSALHANIFPLAFDLPPVSSRKAMMEYIRSKGMVCSVYGSQFLLDAIYNAEDADYGLELLTAVSDRSWYNMIRAGSTISLEAWDNKYKPNQDWNHAWGAAPANLIPRKLMGIEPLEPGFRKIRIKPQPASLEKAEIKLPTIRGTIELRFQQVSGERFELFFTTPANTQSEVWMPLPAKKCQILMDGVEVKARINGKFAIIDTVGSGSHAITAIGRK